MEENANVDVATTESRPDIRPPILSTSTLSTLSTSISTSTSLSSTTTLSTSTSLSSTTSTTPTVDSGSTFGDPLAAPSCPAPAFLCHDATTCLPDNKVCDGIEDCPLHEVGLGGEDEEGCQEAESSGEGEDRDSDDSESEEELSDNMEESNTESQGGRESDPIREPVVGGGSGSTTADAPSSYDVTQISPTSATSVDENENKSNQKIDKSDTSDNNDAPTTRPTLNRVSTSVKPADKIQATTSSSSK